MTDPDIRYDILGIGNAITDILARVDFAFLEKQGLTPGSMTLIDAERANALQAALTPEQVMGGGSVANSCVVAAQFGARVAYLARSRVTRPGLSSVRTCTATAWRFRPSH